MTLSNIFFGKKVVQQAYLNNALIYQSKGWETLPSTFSEVWTKTYTYGEYPKAIDIDSQDNIYIGANDFLYKIDTDGKVIWKVKVPVYKNDTGYWNAVIIKSILVLPDYILCLFYGYESANNMYGFYLVQLDKEGTILKYIDIGSLGTPANNFIYDMTKDNSNIYIVGMYRIVKLDFNLNVVASASNNYILHSVTTTNNSKYVFAGVDQNINSICIIKYDKSTLKSVYEIPYSNSFSSDLIKLDSTNNLYLGNSGNYVPVQKFDAETCSSVDNWYQYSESNSLCQQICTDFQDNVYFVFYVAVNYDKYIICDKRSSDGTFMCSTPRIPVCQPNTRKYDTVSQVAADSNGNIYIVYCDTKGYLAIKKYINLVKEN